jgi:hypothetical protein
MAELHAANSQRVSEFDGPQGRHYQFWLGGRAAGDNGAATPCEIQEIRSTQSPWN